MLRVLKIDKSFIKISSSKPTIETPISKQPEYKSSADFAVNILTDILQPLGIKVRVKSKSPPPVPLDLTPPPLDPSNKPKRYNKYGDEISE